MTSGAQGDESIRVRGLTKRYGPVLALDGTSFSTQPGEIVGFLGPNGAGKSTTMRILTCFMPASEGEAQVAGFDVFRQSLEVRRRIGYLPETVPLYTDMRVSEFLDFRAKIKMRGVRRKQRRERIDWAVEQCHIEEVRNRLIDQLSKGYRRRVGLADTLVHDPEVLILDEPTEGLDPNQTRDLVKQLVRSETADGRARTVLFSTHIIPWVERVCERVVVVDRGRLVADGQAADLIGGIDDLIKIRVRLAGDPFDVVERLRACPAARTVDDHSTTMTETVAVVRGDASDEGAIRTFIEEQIAPLAEVAEMVTEPVDLEDVFRDLTHAAEEDVEAANDELEEVAPGGTSRRSPIGRPGRSSCRPSRTSSPRSTWSCSGSTSTGTSSAAGRSTSAACSSSWRS